MIEIRLRNENWNLKILDEEWEFNSRFEMEQVLEKLLLMKDEFGRINRNYKIRKCD
jgi:hypothetical protein